MAARKPVKKSPRSDGPKAIVVFWLIFVIVIISIALFNWETITRNFNLFKTRLTSSPATEAELVEDNLNGAPFIEETETTRDNIQRIIPEVVVIEPAPRPEATSPTTQTTPAAQTPSAQTPQTPAAQTTTQPTQPSTPAATQTPAAQPSALPVQLRERSIYFAQVSSDGQILQSEVKRRLPVSETPMQDVLNAMLAGPTADELKGNNVNLIPQNTRLLSAVVRGSTAYLSFSEDFMFNSYGIEGYVAQLRQIVWTATEFPNVRDVQILIEGRRVDYLAEGIWIGSPIGRQ